MRTASSISRRLADCSFIFPFLFNAAYQISVDGDVSTTRNIEINYESDNRGSGIWGSCKP